RGLATPLIRWVVAHRLAVCRDVIGGHLVSVGPSSSVGQARSSSGTSGAPSSIGSTAPQMRDKQWLARNA
ncbi:hypothetical protein ABTL46_21505, partial [Acinetobacter baumannii]